MGSKPRERARQQPGFACNECRARKIRCDRATPKCGLCLSAGVECISNTVGQPRGPKRGQMKAMRCRLAALEEVVGEALRHPAWAQPTCSPEVSPSPITAPLDTLVNAGVSKERGALIESVSQGNGLAPFYATPGNAQNQIYPPHLSIDNSRTSNVANWAVAPGHHFVPPAYHYLDVCPEADGAYYSPVVANADFSCAPPMLGQGPSTEPFPVSPSADALSSDTTDQSIMEDYVKQWPLNDAPQISEQTQLELTRVFFKTVHNLLPMINQNLFKATSETWSPALDALTCLRYAMWTVAASMQPAQNPHLQSQLYAHARALLEACEVKLHSQNHVPIEQAQAWILLSLYELTSVSFQRGFLSVGRCYRLVHMMGLSEVDVTSSSMYGPLHCCDTNASSTETEVRRRTFWSAYLLDRFMSFSTPSLWMSIDTCTVASTRLPVAEFLFQQEQVHPQKFLHEAIATQGEETSSSFTHLIILSTMIGQCLSLQRRTIGGRLGSGSVSDDLWESISQSIQASLYQQVPALLSNIELNADCPDQASLLEDMTALVLALCLCAQPGSPTSQAASTKRYERKALSSLVTALSILEIQATQTICCPLMPVPLFMCVMIATARRSFDIGYEIIRTRAKKVLHSLASVNQIAMQLYCQSE